MEHQAVEVHIWDKQAVTTLLRDMVTQGYSDQYTNSLSVGMIGLHVSYRATESHVTNW
jgi:hypothetical protein